MPNQIQGNKPTSIKDRINTRLQTSPAWRDLFEAVSVVLDRLVTQPRNQLATVRDPKKFHRGDWTPDGQGNHVIVNSLHIGDGTALDPDVVHYQLRGDSTPYTFPLTFGPNKERSVTMAQARFHGFNFFSSTITDKDYARIAEWVELFWPESGTENFARFMGFVKGLRIEADALWSTETANSQAAKVAGKVTVLGGLPLPAQDPLDKYPRLEVYDGETPVYLGGVNYPTSHVQLRYDAVAAIANNVAIDRVELYHLFYFIAPIHLVFSRLVAEIPSPPIPIDHFPPAVTLSLYSSAHLFLDATMTQYGAAPKIAS